MKSCPSGITEPYRAAHETGKLLNLRSLALKNDVPRASLSPRLQESESFPSLKSVSELKTRGSEAASIPFRFSTSGSFATRKPKTPPRPPIPCPSLSPVLPTADSPAESLPARLCPSRPELSDRDPQSVPRNQPDAMTKRFSL